ncbi:hypothetical protein NB693_25595 [Pantoea ananatis]|uniref:hypothetical protein n=1 Tax=Pantoea ananas TaxID=553 RepID=UPI00221F4C81|nr:hypothetical protein [Pantoea ananatis]
MPVPVAPQHAAAWRRLRQGETGGRVVLMQRIRVRGIALQVDRAAQWVGGNRRKSIMQGISRLRRTELVEHLGVIGCAAVVRADGIAIALQIGDRLCFLVFRQRQARSLPGGPIH